jgi:hypothetical protein
MLLILSIWFDMKSFIDGTIKNIGRRRYRRHRWSCRRGGRDQPAIRLVSTGKCRSRRYCTGSGGSPLKWAASWARDRKPSFR